MAVYGGIIPETVVTFGAVSKEDGAGGTWRWDASSTATDDTGSVLALSGRAGPGRYLMVFSGTVNARSFGAVGDGTTDDTAAIQAAIDTGKSVFFPPGTYLCGDLSAPRELRIFSESPNGLGSDRRAILLLKPGAANLITIGPDDANSGSTRIYGAQLQHIVFKGNDQVVADAMVLTRTISLMTIRGCNFENVNGTALGLSTIMESIVTENQFRRAGAAGKPVISLRSPRQPNPLTNNLRITNNTFGVCSGSLINSDDRTDLIWIVDNKFEWDANPAWLNAAPTPIIRLALPGRATIASNGFANYTTTNNKYNIIIQLGDPSGASAAKVSVMDNMLFNCEGTFLWTQGTLGLISKNNSNAGNDEVINKIEHIGAIDVDMFGGIRNLKTNASQKNSIHSFYFGDVIPHYYMNFTVQHETLYDPDVVNSADCAVRVPAGGAATVEIARLDKLSQFHGLMEQQLHIKARVKALSADTEIWVISGSNQLDDRKTVPASAGWMWADFIGTESRTINGANPLKFYTSTQGIALDCVVIERGRQQRSGVWKAIPSGQSFTYEQHSLPSNAFASGVYIVTSSAINDGMYCVVAIASSSGSDGNPGLCRELINGACAIGDRDPGTAGKLNVFSNGGSGLTVVNRTPVLKNIQIIPLTAWNTEIFG
jgi:hypothetical protein